MSNGKTHTRITYISGAIIFAGLIVSAILWKFVTLKFAVIFSFAYIFAGCMFSGDLDIKSVQSNRWGILRFVWIPYRRLFSHRSKWTHGAVFGTIVRITYLMAIGVFIWVMVVVLAYINNQIVMTMENKELVKVLDIINTILIYTNKGLLFLKGIFVALTHKYPKEILCVLLGLIAGAFSHDITDIIYSANKRLSGKSHHTNKYKKKKHRR